MSQQQLYNIAIYEESILLTEFKDDTERSFVIKEEDLMEFFKFNKEVKLVPFEGLVWMKSQLEGGDSYLVTIKRAKKKLIHESRSGLKHINMEIPNLAVKASVDSNDTIHIGGLWAYQGELKKSTVLYELALPNISRSSLCMGSAHIKAKRDIIKAIEEALYETPFNHHSHLVGEEKIPFLEYLKKYKGRMPFKTLRPLGRAKQIMEE